MPTYRYVCQECGEDEIYDRLLPLGADCEFCQHSYSPPIEISDIDPIAFAGRHGYGSNLGMIVNGKVID